MVIFVDAKVVILHNIRMDYIELDIPVADEVLSEILVAELSELPFESFSYERAVLKAYIPQSKLADCKEETDEILTRRGIAGSRYVQIESQNWNALWESNFDEVYIDSRAVIRAPFHAPHPELGPMDIVIMPRMSFGTGHHATTAQMTAMILDSPLSADAGCRVADVGCGTGVLAIAALKCGAASADAVDIDPVACENCRENAAANGVAERIHVFEGDVRLLAGNKYDLVMANINRNVLLADMKHYASMLDAGGRLFLSGFLVQDSRVVADAARAEGLDTVCEREMNGWVAMCCVRR